MSNHVTNILRVAGCPERVSVMFEAIRDDEIGLGSLDFNKVIPKPDALDIEWGTRSHRAMKLYKAFVEESTMLATMNVLASQPDAIYVKQVEELLTKYEKLTQNDPELLILGEQYYNNIWDYGHPLGMTGASPIGEPSGIAMAIMITPPKISMVPVSKSKLHGVIPTRLSLRWPHSIPTLALR